MTDAPAGTPAPAPEPPAPLAHCPNCNAVMHGPFCYACGQPKKGLIRHFSSIVGDFVDSVFNFDSRTMRTIGPLYFRPGHLSNEYFAGRRVRYVTPLRLYVFLSVIAFLVIAMITTLPSEQDAADADKDVSEISTAERDRRLREVERSLVWVPEAERARIRAEVARELDKRVKVAPPKPGAKPTPAASPPTTATPAAPAPPAVPTPAADAKPSRDDYDDDDGSFQVNGKEWDPKTNPVRLDWLTDGMNAALNEEIGELIRKAQRIDDDPGPFVKQIYSTAPQTLFVILPVFALLLKAFYIFRRRLYMEHLIVALHSHSFIMFSLLLAIALAKLEEWTRDVSVLPAFFGFLFVLVWIWVPVYLFLMQKRVYRQGWIMTTLKFLVIGFCYFFLLVFGAMLTALVSLILL